MEAATFDIAESSSFLSRPNIRSLPPRSFPPSRFTRSPTMMSPTTVLISVSSSRVLMISLFSRALWRAVAAATALSRWLSFPLGLHPRNDSIRRSIGSHAVSSSLPVGNHGTGRRRSTNPPCLQIHRVFLSLCHRMSLMVMVTSRKARNSTFVTVSVWLGSNPDAVLSGHVGFLRSAACTRGIFRKPAAPWRRLNGSLPSCRARDYAV